MLLIFLFRRSRKLVISAIAFLIIFGNNIVADSLWRLIEYPYQRLDYSSAKSADAIVVLSYGRHMPTGDSKIIEWYDPDRFLSGVELYKNGKSNKLIFTGGSSPYTPNKPAEGDIYIKEANSIMGLPLSDLYTTYPVFNTAQEARAVRELTDELIPKKRKTIILITSAFHMERSKKIFEREKFIVNPYPVDFNSKTTSIKSSLSIPTYWLPNAWSLARSSSAIREIIGRIYYRTWM